MSDLHMIFACHRGKFLSNGSMARHRRVQWRALVSVSGFHRMLHDKELAIYQNRCFAWRKQCWNTFWPEKSVWSTLRSWLNLNGQSTENWRKTFQIDKLILRLFRSFCVNLCFFSSLIQFLWTEDDHSRYLGNRAQTMNEGSNNMESPFRCVL